MCIRIGQKQIGEKQPVFIIAEISANHRQNFRKAVALIREAKETGADAVKLQTFTPDTITIDCDNKYFQLKHGTMWDGKTLHRLYQEAFMPWEWQPKLKKIAEDLGLECFSSPFDATAVDFLEHMDVPAYKIASFEITDIPLIEYVASKKKPVMIATGVATRRDIKSAVEACYRMGNTMVVLLKCTSMYPAPFEEMNLRMIPKLKRDFKCLAGISDHTLGISVPIAAVALGAKVIEKHFILERKAGGLDAPFSLEPAEFKEMVRCVRDVERALGKTKYTLSETGKKNRALRRSLFVVKDIEKGGVFSKENIRSIRPGYGMLPKDLNNILGKKAAKRLKRGTPLSRQAIAGYAK